MACNTTHHHTSRQVGKDNSELQQPCQADDISPCREQSKKPLFYIEADDSTDRTNSATCNDHANRFNKTSKDDDNRCKKKVQWTAGKDVSDFGSDLDGHQNGYAAVADPSRQESRKSSSRSVLGVFRSNSSPVIAVCRQSHCQLVVRCQVNSHALSQPSISCPAAFSPAWTRVVPQTSSSKAGSGASRRQRHRRHTVGPVSHAQQSKLLELQEQHRLDSRGRSFSDSELQQLLMMEVGRELRRMSDEFHFTRTGLQLMTVTESAGSGDDDSDDEM